MAIGVVESVLDLSPALRGSRRLVLVALATYADAAGGSIRPSAETIARRTALSRDQVRRIIRGLKDSGYLIQVARATQHRPPTYRIPPPPTEHGAEPPEGTSAEAVNDRLRETEAECVRLRAQLQTIGRKAFWAAGPKVG